MFEKTKINEKEAGVGRLKNIILTAGNGRSTLCIADDLDRLLSNAGHVLKEAKVAVRVVVGATDRTIIHRTNLVAVFYNIMSHC